MSYSTTLESFAFAFCTIIIIAMHQKVFFHSGEPSFSMLMVDIAVVRGQEWLRGRVKKKRGGGGGGGGRPAIYCRLQAQIGTCFALCALAMLKGE